MKTIQDPVERLHAKDDLLVLEMKAELLSKVGDIKALEIPEEGETIEKGEVFVTIMGSDDDLELHAPLDGVIIEVNEHFSDHLTTKKKKKDYIEWLLKIEPKDPDELLAFEDEI